MTNKPDKPKRKPYTMSQAARNQRRKAGQATKAKHGTEHFKRIGRKGAESTWSKYKLVPIGPGYYKMVDRQTGKEIARR